MAAINGRAQADAGQASILVLVIMIAIILYVLLLPGPIREDLLNSNSSSSGKSSTSLSTYLSENPGTIDYISQREFTHTMPAFNLYQSTNAVELKKVSTFYVKTGLFTTKTRTIPFTLSDPANTGNVMLSFDVSAHHGILLIKCNGNIVFEGEIGSFNAGPIIVDKEYLQQSNTLEFYTEGVGLAFWKTNDYTIQSLRILADITDISLQGTRTSFMVTRIEADNAERLFLKFSPDCQTGSVGKLTIQLNSQEVFSGMPDCNMLNRLELNPALLKTGENTLDFRTNQGSYLVDLVEVDTELKENPAPVYYFDISSSDFTKISGDSYKAELTLEFVDSTSLKEGSVIIDGKEIGIYTPDRAWTRTLDPYLQQGQNAIKIMPKGTLNIVKLTLRLQNQ